MTDTATTPIVRRARSVSRAPAAEAPGWDRTVSRLYWAAAALLAAVIVFHGVRSYAAHWIPTGDDAFLTVRSRAVFSRHPPLFSSASSAGAGAKVTYNHPGPAVLYLTAPAVKLLGSAGMALAMALLNAAAVLVVALIAKLAARPALAAGLLAATAGLVWAMGSQVLIDPWNPHAATLCFLVLLVGTWATWCGVRTAAPLGVAGGAIAAQTHLSFVTPSAVLAAGLFLGVGLLAWKATGDERRRWLTTAILAFVVGVVALLPPLIDEVLHGSDGNLSRILQGSDVAGVTVTPGEAVAVVGTVLARPPFFLRDSWALSNLAEDLLSPQLAAAALVLLLAAGVAAAMLARRRGDRSIAPLFAVGAVTMVVGTVTSLSFPLRIAIPIAYFRWAWPAALVMSVALVVPVLEAAARRLGRRGSRAGASFALGVGLVGATVFSVLTIPPADDRIAGSQEWGQAMARSIFGQSEPKLSGLGQVEVIATIQEGPLMAFTGSLVDRLDAHGVDVRSTDLVILQQIGEQHRATGREPWVLTMVGPDTSLDAGPKGGRRLAVYSELSPRELASLDARARRFSEQMQGATVALTPAGEALHDPGFEYLVSAASRPEEFIRNRLLAEALRRDLISITPRPGVSIDEEALARFAEEAFASDGRTFALWLVPRDAWDARQ